MKQKYFLTVLLLIMQFALISQAQKSQPRIQPPPSATQKKTEVKKNEPIVPAEDTNEGKLMQQKETHSKEDKKIERKSKKWNEVIAVSNDQKTMDRLFQMCSIHEGSDMRPDFCGYPKIVSQIEDVYDTVVITRSNYYTGYETISKEYKKIGSKCWVSLCKKDVHSGTCEEQKFLLLQMDFIPTDKYYTLNYDQYSGLFQPFFGRMNRTLLTWPVVCE